MKTKYFLYFAIVLFVAGSCKPVVDDFTPESGSADLTSYVAVGNSLTAGYADASLYASGQEYGFANILAQQFAYAGGNGTFKIPMMPTEDGVSPHLTPNGLYFTTKLVVGYSTDCIGNVSLAPVPAVPNPDQAKLGAELTTSVAADGPFNNIGVPGVKVGHLLAPGLGMLNPYYGRFAANPATDALIGEAAKVNPTFFSLWIGNNDVLGYASSGGTEDITPFDGPAGVGFAASYTAVLQSLLASADKGVIANIPDITSAAFFTTVPYNPIVLDDQAQVDLLNAAYAPYNGAMAQFGLPYRIEWKLGPNPMVIADLDMGIPVLALNIRQIESDEMVLLTIPQDSIKCAFWGTQKPIPDEYILTAKEINNVKNATWQFNKFIKESASDYGLAFADFNSLMKKVSSTGMVADGITFTNAFITGNLFSLDGIHLTPQGNAIVANFYIDAINSTYGANIPKVNVSDYPPAVLP
ncbi:MAG: hypothetical protein L3J31_00590 [Bacteroidales bacterium]|nr:hypothetical protein [Bacteroidales bacterium]